jgi:hypothetical protein
MAIEIFFFQFSDVASLASIQEEFSFLQPV